MCTLLAFCHTDNNSALTKTRGTPTVSVGSDVCNHDVKCDEYIEGILPKGPYLPCVSMAGRALLAGYHRYILLLKQSAIYHLFIKLWVVIPENDISTHTWDTDLIIIVLANGSSKMGETCLHLLLLLISRKSFFNFLMFFLHVECIVSRRIRPRPSADQYLLKNEIHFIFKFLLYPPYPKDRGMLWFYVKAARRPQWC